MPYDVVPYEPRHAPVLAELMRHSFGMSVPADYFDWKYNRNPSGSVIGYLAMSESGECAAYYGVMPEEYWVDGEPKLIYQSCDTMTHPNHRRKGLFELLAKRCYADVEARRTFIVGFGGATSTPGFIKFGWQRLFDVGYIFRPALLARASQLVRFGAMKNITEVETDLETIATHRTEQAGRHLTRRVTANYLRWRLQNPTKRYTIKMWRLNNETGYCIYNTAGNNFFLLDVGATHERLFKVAMRRIDDEMIHQNVKGIISIAQPSNAYGHSLLRHGFVVNNFRYGPLREKIPFIAYGKNYPTDPSRWQIIPYCYDSF